MWSASRRLFFKVFPLSINVEFTRAPMNSLALRHFPPRAVFASSLSFHSSALLRQAAAPPPPSLADAAQQLMEEDDVEDSLAAKDLSHDDERFVGMTGAEILHDLLKAHEVDQVFGYPGGAFCPCSTPFTTRKISILSCLGTNRGAGTWPKGTPG